MDRLKRAQKLESIKRNNAESLLAVAKAALDAHQLDLARKSAEAAARIKAHEGIYLLLADIEEADTADQGRIRHWLAQAVRAPRDEAWTADGYVAEEWAPVSPITGRLDAFEWRVPVEQLAGPVEQAEAMRQNAVRAIESLPPVTHVAVKEPEAADIIEAETIAEETKPDGKASAVEPEMAPPAPAESGPVEMPEAAPKPAEQPVAAEVVVKPDEKTADAEAPVEKTIGASPAEPVKKDVKDTAAKAEPKKDRDAIEVEPAVKKAASHGSTHIVTDAVGRRDDRGRDLTAKPLDDPGVDDSDVEEEQKSRFRLF
jgi:HemY protein